jgi:hypothetical protein
VIFSSLLFCSCKGVDSESKSELRFFKVSEAKYQEIVNEKPMPKDVNFNIDKSVANRDYPIEVALYNDKKFFYDLPRYGTGQGTWEIVDGKIHLFAETRLFDMHIDIVSLDEEANKLALKFRDRFGPKILSAEKLNQP